MAKFISSSPLNGKSAIPKSHISHYSSDRRSSCPPAVQEIDSNRMPKESLRESPTPRRETIMNLKSIFVRNKPDQTDKNLLASITEDIPCSPKSKGASGESRTITAKLLSPKGNFDESSHISTTLIGKTAKKLVSSSKISRSPSFTSSTKSTLVKLSKPAPSPSAEWEIPSLLQAYPQAIKSSHLSALNLSADAIIRVDSGRRSSSVRDKLAIFEPKSKYQYDKYHDCCNSEENFETSSSNSRHRRQSSKHIATAEWTKKIFVLVSSGYLLQYSGSGRFDRMPEKILQLGKDSVAFASDAIPGKYWVLQVSQSMSSDGTSTANSRSLLSRLNFRGIDYRKVAKSLLLVFDSAEDLESWIHILRREIKMLGGGRGDAESTRYYEKEKPLPLPKPSCQRFLLRDSENDTIGSLKPLLKESKSIEDELNMKIKSDLEGKTMLRHHSVATIRSSIGNYYTANSIFAHDGKHVAIA